MPFTSLTTSKVDGFQVLVSLSLFMVFPCFACVLFIVLSYWFFRNTHFYFCFWSIFTSWLSSFTKVLFFFFISNTEQGNTDIKERNTLIGLYNKCKSYENSLITWDLEAPILTLIKNLSPIWFSTRLTNIAHKYDTQEWSTPWALREGLVTPDMKNLRS